MSAKGTECKVCYRHRPAFAEGYAAAIADAANKFIGTHDTLFTGNQIVDVIKTLLSRGSRVMRRAHGRNKVAPKEPVKQLTCVIAGNHREFLYHFPKPDRNVFYVNFAAQLRGVRGAKVVRVGTWYKRPDLEAIEREVVFVQLPTPSRRGR